MEEDTGFDSIQDFSVNQRSISSCDISSLNLDGANSYVISKQNVLAKMDESSVATNLIGCGGGDANEANCTTDPVSLAPIDKSITFDCPRSRLTYSSSTLSSGIPTSKNGGTSPANLIKPPRKHLTELNLKPPKCHTKTPEHQLRLLEKRYIEESTQNEIKEEGLRMMYNNLITLHYDINNGSNGSRKVVLSDRVKKPRSWVDGKEKLGRYGIDSNSCWCILFFCSRLVVMSMLKHLKDCKSLKSSLQETSAKLIQSESKNAELSQRLSNVMEVNALTVKRLKMENLDASENYCKLSDCYAKIESECKDMQIKIAELTSELKTANEAKEEMETKLLYLRATIDELNAKRDQLKSQVNSKLAKLERWEKGLQLREDRMEQQGKIKEAHTELSELLLARGAKEQNGRGGAVSLQATKNLLKKYLGSEIKISDESEETKEETIVD